MQEGNSNTIITAKVIDEENGIKNIDNVNGIRIKSNDYRILVLTDFSPLLGKVNGDVTFLTSNGEVPYKNIIGYYKHQRNDFTLVIKKDFDGWYKQ